MLNEKEEQVLNIIKRRGPSLPIDIGKELGIETFLASAILSTLINKGYVKISHRKVGSSPLYYVAGQEQIVRNRLYSELNELEKKALERLKELRVAFKEELYPQERVLLSELRDFVAYLQVKKDNKEMFCWKHYSVSDEEFKRIIEERLEPKKIETKKIEIPLPTNNTIKPKEPEDIKVEKSISPQPGKKTKPKEPKSSLDKKVLEYLNSLHATVLSQKLGKNESTYIISVKTPFGDQKYLVKSKNKKSISDGDISKIYVEASSKKLPFILLTTATPSKKIREYIAKNFGDLIKIITLK